MKINEVEKIIGITKKNIRFYEEQGLLSPSRNRENGYREYAEADLEILEQIKLFRKLGLPIEEIRSMQKGYSTVADSMKRHLITIERERQNLSQAQELCKTLSSKEIMLKELNAHDLLINMDQMEKSGTSFKNIKNNDISPIRYVGAVVASIVMTIFMAIIFFIMLWAFQTKPEESPPLPLIIVLMAIPVVIIIGVVFSLIQRISEIKKGETYDAKKF